MGSSPAHEAAKAGPDRLFPVRKSKYELKLDLVRILIRKTFSGESPFSLSLKYSESTVIDILLEHGAKSNLNK